MLVRFKYRLYYDEKTGYSICKYRDIERNITVSCLGNNLPTMAITYDFDCKEERSPKYGTSYRVLSWEDHVGDAQEDIIEYLSCGLFKGISKRIAGKIYDMFGDQTMYILDNEIEKLIEVPGIGKKTVAKIQESYIEKRASRELAKTLIKYDFSANLINKIYMKYKADAVSILENNPYKLCEVRGVTFPMVDRIARDKGFKTTLYDRVKAASDYIFEQDMALGNVCMPKCEYGLKLIDILHTPSITKGNIMEYVLELMHRGDIKYNKRVNEQGKEEYFYHPSAYKVEREIAGEIRRLLNKSRRVVPNIDKLIDKYSEGITLDETQRNAVKVGVKEPIFIITGGPGTGKTTILKIIAQINTEINKGTDNNVFMSPTGRAARRITESTGYTAKTIHSALKLGVSDEEDDIVEFGEKEEHLIKKSRVIVDEASMIDMWVMKALLTRIEDCSLGLIGDVDQLPSVRCGSILRDLILSEIVPCVQLEHIHRQSVDAINICENAKYIKEGRHILGTGEDFEIKDAETLEEAEEELIGSALYNLAYYGAENVKVLCAFKKGPCGVFSVNKKLQEILNHKEETIKKEVKIPNGMVLRVGDPVMQLKNIEEVANGDIGYVMYIDDETVSVLFHGDPPVDVEYSHAEAKEQLTLAYATTVHKSQGSEYDAIVMCLTNQHGIMKKRNILYTGITRGKHKVVLVGTKEAFFDAIDNNMIEDRHSTLAELINPTVIKKNTSNIVKIPVAPRYEQLVLPGM